MNAAKLHLENPHTQILCPGVKIHRATAGARSTGRLNIILYQFGFIRGQYLMVIRFNQCFHGCLHYRIKKVISEHFFLRDATNVSSKQCDFCYLYDYLSGSCGFWFGSVETLFVLYEKIHRNNAQNG